MGVDIGVKRQTSVLKLTYEWMEKAFGSRDAFINDESHPFYAEYKKYNKIIDTYPLIEEKTGHTAFDDLRGARWFNLSLNAPDSIPFCEKTDILSFSIKQQILFTEEIKKISEKFDKIYLKLYPNDSFVKHRSEFFHYLVDNNLMLIPS